MKKQIRTNIGVVVLIAAMTACQSQQNEGGAILTSSKETVINQNIRANESGYADVNGLRVCFEILFGFSFEQGINKG